MYKIKPLYKKEMVEYIQKHTGYDGEVISKVIDEVFLTIKICLAETNRSVLIDKFGTFEKTHVNERVGRDPVTGGLMTHPAKNRVKFKANKSLLDMLNP